MPRAVKESDEETDTRTGRRSRALTEAVDFGRRRSSRLEMNKQESSPEVSPKDASIQTRSKRRTTGQQLNENVKSLRPRLNSISSDISEKDDTPRTRARNAANNRRSSRLTRASSEVSSTASPVTRSTRRTRANSMEPESTTDNEKGKKNLVFPSEATLLEEMEETLMNPVVSLERTLAVQVKSKNSPKVKQQGEESGLEDDKGVEEEHLTEEKEIPKLDDDEKENRGDSNKEAKQSFHESVKKEDNKVSAKEDNKIPNERWKLIVDDDDTDSLKDNCIVVDSVDSLNSSIDIVECPSNTGPKSPTAISKSPKPSENKNTKESVGIDDNTENEKESTEIIENLKESVEDIGILETSFEDCKDAKNSEDLKSVEKTGHIEEVKELIDENSIKSEENETMSQPLETERPKNSGDSAKSFFKDIPLREWSQHVDKLSELSASTEKMNESEGECDLVLQDKDSVQNSDESDSDDTVVLQKSSKEHQCSSLKTEILSPSPKTQTIKEVEDEEKEPSVATIMKAMNSSKKIDDQSVEKNDSEELERMEALNKSTERAKEYLEKSKNSDGKKKFSMGKQEDCLNKSIDINEKSKESLETLEKNSEGKEKVVEQEEEDYFEAVNKSTEMCEESKGSSKKSKRNSERKEQAVAEEEEEDYFETVNKSTEIHEDPKGSSKKSKRNSEKKEEAVAEEEEEDYFEAVNKSTDINEESKKSLETSKEDPEKHESMEIEMEVDRSKLTEKSSSKSRLEANDEEEEEKMEVDEEDCSKMNKSTDKTRESKTLEESKEIYHKKLSTIGEINEPETVMNESPGAKTLPSLTPSLKKTPRRISTNDEIKDSDSVKKSSNRKTLSESKKTSVSRKTPRKISTNDELSETEAKIESRKTATVPKLNKAKSTNNEISETKSGNEMMQMPKFLFYESNSDSSSSEKGSIDSDVKKAYNLDGDDEPMFSDNDVPGDECRASETESSDPNDDGSDLKDFVVDDDEVVEESSSEEEKSKDGEDDSEENEVDLFDKEKSKTKKVNRGKNKSRIKESDGSEDQKADLVESKSDVMAKKLKKKKKVSKIQNLGDSEDEQADLLITKSKPKDETLNKSKNKTKIPNIDDSKVQQADSLLNDSKIKERSLNRSKIYSSDTDSESGYSIYERFKTKCQSFYESKNKSRINEKDLETLEKSNERNRSLTKETKATSSESKDHSLNESKNKAKINEEDLETLEKSNERNGSVTKETKVTSSESIDQSLNKSKNKSIINEEDLETLEKSNERNRSIAEETEVTLSKSKDQCLNKSKNKLRMNEENLENLELLKSKERNKSITEETEASSSKSKESSSQSRKNSTENKSKHQNEIRTKNPLGFIKIIQTSTPKSKNIDNKENQEEVDEEIKDGDELELSDSKSHKENASFLHRSLPTVMNVNLAVKKNLSRSISTNVSQLNRTEFIKDCDTPNTKFLKKDKLNESAPALKLNVKDGENEKESIVEKAKASDKRLKESLFKVAENILETEQRMKKKNKRDKKKIAVSNIQEAPANDDEIDEVPKPKNKKKKNTDIKELFETLSKENEEVFLRKISQNLQTVTENSDAIPSEEPIVQKSKKMKRKEDTESEEPEIIILDGIEYVGVDLPLDSPKKKKEKQKSSKHPESSETETDTKLIKKPLKDSRFDLPIAGTSKPDEKKSKNIVKTNVNSNSSDSCKFPTVAFPQRTQEALDPFNVTLAKTRAEFLTKLKQKQEESEEEWRKLKEVFNKKRKWSDSESSIEENYCPSTTKFDIVPLKKLKSKKKRFGGDIKEDYGPSLQGSTMKFDMVPLNTCKLKKSKKVLVTRRC